MWKSCIFALKNEIYNMFTELQTNPVINDLWCIPYETLSKNPSTKEKCLTTFPHGLPDNSNIIYSSSDEEIIVLGYYVIDDANITSSKYYESLRNITLQFQGVDETSRIKQTDCVHIKAWVFDNSLKDEAYLENILFGIIRHYPHKKRFFLWYDNNQGNLCFYPIDKSVAGGSICALTHFKNDFLKQ